MSREKPKPVGAKQEGGRPGSPGEGQEPPARAAAYIPPMAVPKESRYHTIDMKAVRLSPDIDPKRMKTQLSLRAVQAATIKPPSRIPAWIALLCAGGAVGTAAWWFLRWQHVQDQTSNPATAVASPVVVVATDVVATVVSPTPVSPEVLVQPLPGGGEPGAVTAPAEATALEPAALEPAGLEGAVVTPSSLPQALPMPAVPPAPQVIRPRSRTQSSKVHPAPRNVTAPAPGPAPEVSASASSQPKLWLE